VSEDSKPIVLILGILAAYCLYLGALEIASMCIGALAGVLTQRTQHAQEVPK
jgi:hypothetical protein